MALTCLGCLMTGVLGCRPSMHDTGSVDDALSSGSSLPLASASAPTASSSPLPPLVGLPAARVPEADTVDVRELQTPAQIHKFVADELRQINGMPPKCSPHMLGIHASHIEALGKRAAPYLVEKLTDTTLAHPAPCGGDLIGDYAEEILDALYDCEGPDDLPCSSDVYCGRNECLKRPGQRARLQASWARFVARDGA